MTQQTDSPIDLADLESWAVGDRQLVNRILLCFVEAHAATLHRLQEAVDSGAIPTVVEVAHQLKSQLMNFGAEPAWTIAGAIEDSARDGELSAAPRLMAELHERVGDVVVHLRLAAEGSDSLY